MAQYLVAIHHPDNYGRSREDEAMDRDIYVLNQEMVAAGVRIFVGGLRPPSSAKSLRAQPAGKVLITEGPYIENQGAHQRYLGGGGRRPGRDAGVGRKAAVACLAPVEARQSPLNEFPSLRVPACNFGAVLLI